MFSPRVFCVWLFAGICILLAPLARALDTNDAWSARSWLREDGVPDNNVDAVAQTGDGYLWVGTPSGLARFDGLRFETISLTNVIPLPNRGIVTMKRGHRGTLWLAMDRGAVVRLSGATSRAYIEELPKSIPNGLTEDAEGGLWISYRSGNVYRIKDDHVALMAATNGMPDGPDICALTTDGEGRVWYAKAGQVGVFSNGLFHLVQQLDLASMRVTSCRNGGVWVCCGFTLFHGDTTGGFTNVGEFHPENSGNVATAITEDSEGDVWIGTSYNGIYRYGAGVFQAVATSQPGILDLDADSEGNIWVGTAGGGLNCIRRRAITLEGSDQGLEYPAVQSICQATDGTLWAVTQNGVLVHKIDNLWTRIPVGPDWPGDATCAASDTNGAVWVGTHHNGLFCWRDGKFVSWGDMSQTRGMTFHTLLTCRNGDIWIGEEAPNPKAPNFVLRLRNGRIKSFPISSDNRIIRAMAEDASGHVFVGTSKGVLFRVDGDTITDVTPRPTNDLASIRCLYATSEGSLWLGYAGWGVGRLQGDRYTEFNADNGLFDERISHIVDDGNGWLWFGANGGLYKVRMDDFDGVAAGRFSRIHPVHYGRGDGLPSLQGTFGSSPDVLRSHDGKLYIPMETGLLVVDPEKTYENASPPPTLLTRVTVDGQVVAEYDGVLPPQVPGTTEIQSLPIRNEPLHLDPGHRNILFEFAAFDFRAPENIQFRYRLEGLPGDWNDLGPQHTVTLPRLDSGRYTFELSACNGNGDWNQNTSRITLIVPDFFWNTWWFRLGVLAAFTLCVVAIVRYVSFRRLRVQLRQLEQQAALQRERARIAKDIHDDLGANLTQIAFMGELANQDRDNPSLVGDRIGKISATARQAVKSLDEIVWAVNPRNDTLSHLLDYAGQYAVDYLRLMGIRCRLDFPETVPVRELSTDLRHNLFLVVKEALHNIFKHANATEVRLRAVVDERALEMVIEDNGRGFEQTPDNALSDGLRNMRQRMADIGGECRVESGTGRGTKIILRLPWPEPK